MKKIGLVIMSAVVLAGCANSNLKNFEVDAKEEQTVKQYTFDYRTEISYEGNLNVKVIVENSDKTFVPLNFKGENFFRVELYDAETDQHLETKVIATKNRVQLQRSERVDYNTYFEVVESGKYRVKVIPQMKNTETSLYDGVRKYITESLEVEVLKNNTYYPVDYSKKRNYEYVYKTAAGNDVVANYAFYEDSMIQGVSSAYGVVIYNDTPEGLKVTRINDYVGDVSALDYIDEDDMELIIPNEPYVGQTWKNGDYQMTIMGLNSKTKTVYGELEQLVRVRSSKDKQIKEYFFDRELGLVKIVQIESNSSKPITELQLSKVNVR